MRVGAKMNWIAWVRVNVGSSTIHAQGLERLDGVMRPQLDKCFDDVEAPYYHIVRHLKGVGSSKKPGSLVKEDIIGRRFACILVGKLPPLGPIMLQESLDGDWR